VAEAAVVGMKDLLMGEDVVAFVVVKDGGRVSAEEIAAFCETRLARFKCPKQIRFVDSLPKSPIGKILRKELRTQV
jgi:acyl-CoA synthetase (AMP-forming)/AMP-acid ligase II